MATKAELIQVIRYGLAQLSATNSHHEFEKLCLHFAKARIASNLLPATGPVAGGGDQGKDFETFKTYYVADPGGTTLFGKLASPEKIAFASTTEKERGLKAKIENDIQSIMSQGVPPDRIYVFTTENVKTSLRHKLQETTKSAHNVSLEIVDGQALSTHLADSDIYWIARTYLHLPERLPADLYHEQFDTPAARSQARTGHLSRIAKKAQAADYRGIAGVKRSEYLVALPLEDVYIPPSLSEWTGDTVSQDPTEEEGLTIGKVLSRGRRTVILGPAGSGKSTLIRFLARLCALGEDVCRNHLGWSEPLIPVIVSLASFAEARSQRPELSFGVFLNETVADNGGEALSSAITEDLEKGRVFLLLNGLDEVTDTQGRSRVIHSIEIFFARYPANRLLVTSRLYGFTPLAGGFRYFQLSRLEPTQIEAFVNCWYRAYEAWQHPEAPDFSRAKQDAQATYNQICRNPRIRDLASNPLMLSILVLLRQEGTHLPERRIEVYDRVIRTLVETWWMWRSPEGLQASSRLVFRNEQVISAVGSVAAWIRREHPSGLVRRTELKRHLVKIIQDWEAFDLEDFAENLLQFLIDQAGLLQEQGHDLFRFWHPTFEEFFAAVDLATSPAEKILPLRSSQNWREIILLCISWIGRIQHDAEAATIIVEAIAYRDQGLLEPIFHTNLLLAADCIAEDPGVTESLTQSIVAQLAEILHSMPYSPFTEAFSRAVGAHPKLRPAPEHIAIFNSLLDRSRLGESALRLISNLAPFDTEARRICDERRHQWQAALGLARSGDSRKEIWSVLLTSKGPDAVAEGTLRRLLATAPEAGLRPVQRILQTSDVRIRLTAAERLLDLGACKEEAVDALSRTLEDGDADQRFVAASRLIEMGHEEDAAIQTLTSFTSDEASYRQGEIATILARLGHTNDAVRVLQGGLESGDIIECLWAAKKLLEFDFGQEKIAQALIEHLASGEAPQVAYYLEKTLEATELLEKLQPNHQGVISGYRSCLSAFDDKVSFVAAVRLIKRGHSDPRILEILVGCITNYDEMSRRALDPEDASELLMQIVEPWLTSEDLTLRSGAAELMTEIGRVDEPVIEALLSCIEPMPGGKFHPFRGWDPRFRALDVLFELGVDTQRIIPRIETWLSVENFPVQLNMAEYLIEETRETGMVARSLYRRLAGPVAERLEAAKLLLKLKRADETVVAAVKSVLESDDPALLLAASVLLEVVGEFGEVEAQALALCLDSADRNFRYRAAALLIRQKRTEPSPIPALTELLTTEQSYQLAEVAGLLLGHGKIDQAAFEPVLQILEADPRLGPTVLRRVGYAPLDREDIATLLALVSTRVGDGRNREIIREALFRWIYSELAPDGRSGIQSRNLLPEIII